MQEFQSSAFGPIPQPVSFDELLAIACSSPLTSSRVRMWRGQADAHWPLHSGAYRRLSRADTSVSEHDVCVYETRLLEAATHRGYRAVGGRLLSDMELLARLQHHGAATRLVDMSRSLLVALWFAVAEHPSETGALIGLHSDFLGGAEGMQETRLYADLMGVIAKHDHPFTWEPTAVSPRVAAQHSQFVLSRVVDRPSGSLCLSANTGASTVLAISPELKAVVRDLLTDLFDVRGITLFPDVDGFARANGHSVDQGEMHRW